MIALSLVVGSVVVGQVALETTSGVIARVDSLRGELVLSRAGQADRVFDILSTSRVRLDGAKASAGQLRAGHFAQVTSEPGAAYARQVLARSEATPAKHSAKLQAKAQAEERVEQAKRDRIAQIEAEQRAKDEREAQRYHPALYHDRFLGERHYCCVWLADLGARDHVNHRVTLARIVNGDMAAARSSSRYVLLVESKDDDLALIYPRGVHLLGHSGDGDVRVHPRPDFRRPFQLGGDQRRFTVRLTHALDAADVIHLGQCSRLEIRIGQRDLAMPDEFIAGLRLLVDDDYLPKAPALDHQRLSPPIEIDQPPPADEDDPAAIGFLRQQRERSKRRR